MESLAGEDDLLSSQGGTGRRSSRRGDIPKYGTLLILPFSGQELVADVEVLVPAAVDTAWGEVGDAAHVVKHVDPVVRHHLGCYLDLKGVQKVDPIVR